MRHAIIIMRAFFCKTFVFQQKASLEFGFYIVLCLPEAQARAEGLNASKKLDGGRWHKKGTREAKTGDIRDVAVSEATLDQSIRILARSGKPQHHNKTQGGSHGAQTSPLDR
jgi:hypothetical protein